MYITDYLGGLNITTRGCAGRRKEGQGQRSCMKDAEARSISRNAGGHRKLANARKQIIS